MPEETRMFSRPETADVFRGEAEHAYLIKFIKSNRWAICTENALTVTRKRPRIIGQIQYSGIRKECFCKVICHKTTFS